MTQQPPERGPDDPRAGAPRFQPALVAGAIAAIILVIAIAGFWAQH